MSSNIKTVVGNGVFLLSAIAFAGALVYTYILIGKSTTTSDADVDKILTQIAYVNGALVALMTLIAFSFTNAYPAFRDRYILILTHFALFLSVLSVSILAIQRRSA